jgi:hypothetical protein
MGKLDRHPGTTRPGRDSAGTGLWNLWTTRWGWKPSLSGRDAARSTIHSPYYYDNQKFQIW